MTTPRLPPSCTLVLAALDETREATHKELVKRTMLAPGTVRYALQRLKQHHLIIEKLNIRDARQIIYLPEGSVQ